MNAASTEKGEHPKPQLVGVFNPFEAIRQIGSFPQVGVKMKNLWNHHLDNNTPKEQLQQLQLHLANSQLPHLPQRQVISTRGLLIHLSKTNVFFFFFSVLQGLRENQNWTWNEPLNCQLLVVGEIVWGLANLISERNCVQIRGRKAKYVWSVRNSAEHAEPKKQQTWNDYPLENMQD